MKTKHTQQVGSGVMAVLLAIAVALVLSGSAYLLYHSHHKKSPENTSTVTDQSTKPTQKSDSTTTKPSTPATTYFTIKEWGIQAPYSGSDLTYSADSANTHMMWINSRQLGSDSSACKITTDSGNAGIIGRYLPTDTLPGPAQETAQQYFSQAFSASNSGESHFAKIGSYYYLYMPPQDNCSTNTTLENQVQDEIGNLVANFQATS